MTGEVFEQLVKEAIDEIPPEFRKFLKGMVILVADEPDEEQVRLSGIRKYDRLFGLFQGVPLNAPGADRKLTPNRITLFRRAITEAYDTDEEIKEQIKNTLFHEVGHYFGLSERELRKYR